MADLEHGLTIHELELAETILGDSFVAIDDGTNTKKAKIANLNSASATSAQTYAQAAAASAAASASSATQAQTSAQSIQSAMVQATSQLQGYVDDAAASASSAAASEANIRGLITSDYAKLARSYATGDSGYREGEETDNAKYYSEQSESYVDAAAAQAVISGQKADLSEDHAEESEDHALESEGHALGTQNGTPVSSDSPYYHNNAKYWADEARQSSAGGVAASVIATAEPTNISSHAYAIGDQFVYNGILYTATSAISVGDTIAPGTNCSISDTITEQIGNAGKVTGVKGNAESTYRTGNVNMTPADIGLGDVDNTSDADKPVSTATKAALNGKVSTDGASTNTTVAFTSNDLAANTTAKTDTTANQPSTVAKLASGETLASMFGKISSMFASIRKLWNTVGTTAIDSSLGTSLTAAVNKLYEGSSGGTIQQIYKNTSAATDNTTHTFNLPSGWKKLIVQSGFQPENTTVFEKSALALASITKTSIRGFYNDGAEFCINQFSVAFTNNYNTVTFTPVKAWNAHYGMTTYGTFTNGGFISYVGAII